MSKLGPRLVSKQSLNLLLRFVNPARRKKKKMSAIPLLKCCIVSAQPVIEVGEPNTRTTDAQPVIDVGEPRAAQPVIEVLLVEARRRSHLRKQHANICHLRKQSLFSYCGFKSL
ncbi:hypothetical protein QYF36_023512 [Acer negundo]|nr:hypothetical protein QYF36_023512 [Acer negundo]